MKAIIYIAIFLCSLSISSQENYSFNLDGVEIQFKIECLDTLIKEEVKIINYTDKDIYIPEHPKEVKKHFFKLKDGLHSYSGVKNSLTGGMNLGGRVVLKKIEKGDSLSYNVDILNHQEKINKYYFSFDFATNEDIKELIEKKDDLFYIKSKDYYTLSKTIFSTRQ